MLPLTRLLKYADGTPRVGVQVVFWNAVTSYREVRISDGDGRFSIDLTNVPSGTYELRYLGDGIVKTVRDDDGLVLVEDSVTPWELGIQIVNVAAGMDTTPPIDSDVALAQLES
jgi:hypothetical protein